MGITKILHSRNMEDILQALAPLNQHVFDNNKRFLKALAQREYIMDENGRIKWSPFLLSGKIKKIDKETEEKLKAIDLIRKSREFMEGVKSYPSQFHLEIIEYCDGFQVNLSATKDTSQWQKNEALLDFASYFVWKSY